MAFMLLVLVLIASMVLIVLGLPGLWIMIASAITYNIVVPPPRPMSSSPEASPGLACSAGLLA